MADRTAVRGSHSAAASDNWWTAVSHRVATLV